MSDKVNKIFCKYFALLVFGVVCMTVPIISQECHLIWYQPKEPVNLEMYMKTMSKKLS